MEWATQHPKGNTQALTTRDSAQTSENDARLLYARRRHLRRVKVNSSSGRCAIRLQLTSSTCSWKIGTDKQAMAIIRMLPTSSVGTALMPSREVRSLSATSSSVSACRCAMFSSFLMAFPQRSRRFKSRNASRPSMTFGVSAQRVCLTRSNGHARQIYTVSFHDAPGGGLSTTSREPSWPRSSARIRSAFNGSTMI
jgi:hypothetical protein